MDRDAAKTALVKLARQAMGTPWREQRSETFLGDATVATANTLYRFVDGVFAHRAARPTDGAEPAWTTPTNMKGVELIGFLAHERGLWSLSPRWRSGSLAVITTPHQAYTLTSPTFACEIVRRENHRIPAADAGPPHAFTRRAPSPCSFTRVQSAPVQALPYAAVG